MKHFPVLVIFLSVFLAVLSFTQKRFLTDVFAQTKINPSKNLKIAFIGDTGYEQNYISVLNLIKSEGAKAVIHLGDFDYKDDPDGFFSVMRSVLGNQYPYVAIVGNHDLSSWNEGCSDSDGCYATFAKQQMSQSGIVLDNQNINDQMFSFDFGGVKFVTVGQNAVGNQQYAPYIKSELQNDNHLWKVCAWHKNQKAMQLGEKTDEMGWDVYENCRQFGAIIATAHEHSYHRTKTLTNFTNQTVDTLTHPLVGNVPSQPDTLRVEPGKTFAFVSGSGGFSIRPQVRCLPSTYPYGCNYEWAKVYTSSQGGQFGALFIEFNIDNQPSKARGYFKTISGTVVDQFSITTPASSSSPAPTKPGDADNDGDVDGVDYTRWLNNYNTQKSGNEFGDFNASGFIDGIDYTIWLNNYGK